MNDASPPPVPAPTVTLLDPKTHKEATLILSADAAEPSDDGRAYRFRRGGPDGDGMVVEAPVELVEQSVLRPPCPVCGCRHLYRQRDFNRNLGLTVVVAAAALGLLLSAIQGTIAPLVACLVAASLLDAAIFSFLPEVVVCYRCLSSFRRIKAAEEIGPYDQHIADGFEFPGS